MLILLTIRNFNWNCWTCTTYSWVY
jgi:hypothetical protein